MPLLSPVANLPESPRGVVLHSPEPGTCGGVSEVSWAGDACYCQRV